MYILDNIKKRNYNYFRIRSVMHMRRREPVMKNRVKPAKCNPRKKSLASEIAVANSANDVIKTAKEKKLCGGIGAINISLSNDDNDILNSSKNKSLVILKALSR